jgi:hypothetical protein
VAVSSLAPDGVSATAGGAEAVTSRPEGLEDEEDVNSASDGSSGVEVAEIVGAVLGVEVTGTATCGLKGVASSAGTIEGVICAGGSVVVTAKEVSPAKVVSDRGTWVHLCPFIDVMMKPAGRFAFVDMAKKVTRRGCKGV